MKKRNLIFVIIAFLSIAVSSCKKDKSPEVNPVTPPAMEYVKIDEFKTSNGKFDVEIYGVEKYFSGYNSLYFLVKDGEGNKLSSVDISMDLSLKNQDKTSKLPVNNPVNKLGTNGYFIGGAVFLVKGDAENTYDLNLKFKANEIGRAHV